MLTYPRELGRYASLLSRQVADLKAFQKEETLLLHPDIDYDAIEGMSREVKERLKVVRPASVVS